MLTCADCGQPIIYGHCYAINGEYVCEGCLEAFHKITVKDAVEQMMSKNEDAPTIAVADARGRGTDEKPFTVYHKAVEETTGNARC